jgi:hypothetical protein
MARTGRPRLNPLDPVDEAIEQSNHRMAMLFSGLKEGGTYQVGKRVERHHAKMLKRNYDIDYEASEFEYRR